MKKSILSLILFFIYFNVFSQEAPGRVIKVYSDFRYQTSNTSGDRFQKFSVLPAFSYARISGNKNFSELQFHGLMFRNNENSDFSRPEFHLSTEFSVSARYSYNIRLFKSRDWSVIPFLGLSASPFYRSESGSDFPGTFYFRTVREGGFDFEIIPRININITESVFLDINIPLRICQMSYRYLKIDNPAIPENQRVNRGTQFNVFSTAPELYQLQVGLGLKF
jgi:hypothetical protein